MKKVMLLLLILWNLGFGDSKSYNYTTTCIANAFLNVPNFQCKTCPNAINQIQNKYQIVPISCQCAKGFIVSSNTCVQLAASNCGTTSSNFYAVNDLNGLSSSSVSSCTNCEPNAYPNEYFWCDIEMQLPVFLVELEWIIVLPRDAIVCLERRVFLAVFLVLTIRHRPMSIAIM